MCYDIVYLIIRNLMSLWNKLGAHIKILSPLPHTYTFLKRRDTPQHYERIFD